MDGGDGSFEHARGRVTGPAIGLIVTAAISVAFVLLALTFDAWLLVSGTAQKMAQPRGMPRETQLMIRGAWSCLMLATDAVILAGALRMMRLRGRGLAQAACILAVIPCIGPCFVIGFPFGIWGLVVLNDAQVRRAFDGRKPGPADWADPTYG